MYGKIFQSIYDGTLGGHWEALITFEQMIVLCDDQGVIDMTANALHRRTSIPLDIIEIGIEHLEAPDEESRMPEEEGRRIIRISADRDWGWQIVNHRYYRNLASHEEKKQKDRERIAEKRENKDK